MVDDTKLNAFIGKILGDLGGAVQRASGAHGRQARLIQGAQGAGSHDASGAGEKTNVAERYAREWLSHQAASGYLEYDAATGKFTLPPEQAMVFADPDSPVYLAARLRHGGGHAGKPAAGRAGVPFRQRRRLGRPVAMSVLHDRTLLPCRAIKTISSAPGCRR